MPDGRRAVSMSLTSHSACALLDNGSVACWGNNDMGSLGDGTRESRSTPRYTSSSDGLRAIALRKLRRARRWIRCLLGRFREGPEDPTEPSLCCLGDFIDGEQDALEPTLMALPGGRTAVAISYYTCFIGPTSRTEREISPHGRGGPGYIGTFTLNWSGHACALLEDGEIACWGSNQQGSLGIGDADCECTNDLPSSELYLEQENICTVKCDVTRKYYPPTLAVLQRVARRFPSARG